jgi:hypothetical protein
MAENKKNGRILFHIEKKVNDKKFTGTALKSYDDPGDYDIDGEEYTLELLNDLSLNIPENDELDIDVYEKNNRIVRGIGKIHISAGKGDIPQAG